MNNDKHPLQFADELLARAKEQYKEVEAQREEIMTAFVAKYGFDPDHAMQIYGKMPDGSQTYHVIHLPEHQMERVRDIWLMSKVSEKPLTKWERFCIRLARLPRKIAGK